jgi:hypothetical protein
VPVSSQLGLAINSKHNILPLPTFESRRVGSLSDSLHMAILNDEMIWHDLFTQRIQSWLLQEVGAGTRAAAPGSSPARRYETRTSTARTATKGDSAQGPPVLPAKPKQGVLKVGGVLTPAAPAASASFVIEASDELGVTLRTANTLPVVTLTGPGGISYQAITVNGLNARYDVSGAATGIEQTLTVARPQQGSWKVEFAAPDGGGGPNLPAAGASWEIAVGARSLITLTVTTPELNFLHGETLRVTAVVQNGAITLRARHEINASVSGLSRGDIV